MRLYRVRCLVVLVALLVATTARATPCPSSRTALVDVARKAFPADRRTVGDRELPLEPKRIRCNEIRGHDELALITYDANEGIVLGAVVSVDNVRWTDGQAEDCTPCTTDRSFALVDLDGDGRDELLVRVHRTGHMSTSADQLDVWTIGDDDVPVAARSLTLGVAASNQGHEDGHSDDYACSSSLRIIAGGGKSRRLELVGRCSGAVAPRDYLIGRHVYALQQHGHLEPIQP